MSIEALWLLQGHEVDLNLGNKLFYKSIFFKEAPVVWTGFIAFIHASYSRTLDTIK